jgi:hypothetical protein
MHLSLLEGAQETGKVRVHTSTRVERIEQGADRHGDCDQRQALDRPGADRRRRRASVVRAAVRG